MPKIPTIKAKQMITVATRIGFIHEHTSGSHHIFRRPSDRKHLSIPVHSGHDLGRGLTRSLIKDMDITPDEFIKHLKRK